MAMLIKPVSLMRADVAELLYVERNSLGDSDYTIDEALDVLRSPAHLCLGCYVEEALVGFLSCIETWGPLGARLEMDMLGVLSAHRRRGYARELVARALDQATGRHCTMARAVVAVDNTASQTVFHSAGFEAVVPCTMLVWDRHASSGAAPSERLVSRQLQLAERPDARATATEWANDTTTFARATSIQVATLAYRGCWIEEISGRSPEDCAALVTRIGCDAVMTGLAEAGVLAPRSAPSDIAALVSLGWRPVGDYDIFTRQL